MNEQQITCFVAVAETLSFSGAAQRLYLSQPTVTYQIKSLENELGRRLFERMSHSVALTQEGEAFLPAAENLLRAFETARQTIAGKPGIRIAVPPTVFLREGDFSQHMAAQIREAVGLNVQYEPIAKSPQDSVLDLVAGRIDLLIVARHSAEPYAAELCMDELFTSEQFAILPPDHPLAARSSIAPEDLRGETLLLSEEDTCLLPEIHACLARKGIAAQWRRFSSYRILLPFVEMGQGISFIDRVFTPRENIVFRPFELDREQRIVLCSRKSAQEDANLRRARRILAQGAAER